MITIYLGAELLNESLCHSVSQSATLQKSNTTILRFKTTILSITTFYSVSHNFKMVNIRYKLKFSVINPNNEKFMGKYSSKKKSGINNLYKF